MKKNRKNILLFFLFFVLLFSANSVFALEVNYPNLPFGISFSQVDLPHFLRYIYGALLLLGFIAASFIFVWGGILYFFAGISPDKITSAKEKMSGAFFGMMILISSYLILNARNPKLTDFA